MRQIIVGTFVSLDGVMQAPGGPEEDPSGGFPFGGWVFPHWDDMLGARIDELFAGPFDLLLGRRTYEIFAAYWPFQDDPLAAKFNAATKFVATHSSEPLAWHNSVAIRGDVPAELARLKQEDGPNLIVQGSGVLIQTLLAHGLVDELRPIIFPVLLGTGKKLFADGTAPAGLTLVDSAVSKSGAIMTRYLPAGQVPTGSFVGEDPSQAEQARRERWKANEASA